MIQYSIIAAVALLEVALFWLGRRKPAYHPRIPGLMTTLGILGTFLGITIAIYGFSSVDISDSVPRLLDGMKIAFVTSLLGLFSSVVYRWLPSPRHSRDSSDDIRHQITAIRNAVAPEDGEPLSVQLEAITGKLPQDDHISAIRNAVAPEDGEPLSAQLEAITGKLPQDDHISAIRNAVAPEGGEPLSAQLEAITGKLPQDDDISAIRNAVAPDSKTTLTSHLTAIRQTIGDKGISRTLTRIHDELREKAKALVDAVGGDDDHSLVGRVEILRADLREHFDGTSNLLKKLSEAHASGFQKLDELTNTIHGLVPIWWTGQCFGRESPEVKHLCSQGGAQDWRKN